MVKKRGDFIKKGIVLIIVLFVLALLLFYFFIIKKNVSTCGDGTPEGNCSVTQPYFCLDEALVEKAFFCGCPDVLTKKGNICASTYQTNPKKIILNYILRGEEKKINFTVYEGMVDYISQLSKSIYYFGDEKPLRKDFKIQKINEKEQRQLLLPLVVQIQNLAKDKRDQVRIAISLVQRIPYGESRNNITIGLNQINYSRYAYEVLYEMKGACEGKSELLAFLLKEMGYGVVLFYYPAENHEAVGVKCPVKYSLNGTGYCFIEPTGSSILSNSQEYYLGWGKLTSEPEIIPISDGNSLDKNFYEYKDAKEYIKLNEIVQEKGELNIFRHLIWKSLKEKYGLDYINL